MTKRGSIVSLFCCLIYLLPSKSFGQVVKQSTDSAQVANTMTAFIKVFSNLEWDEFTQFFSDDATAFFPPSTKYPYRANNKMEIEEIFKKFFEANKKQNQAAPYLTIIPKDVKIQIFNSTAIVSFMLDDPSLFGRRSFILEKRSGKWLIIHLHASGVTIAN